MKKISKKISMLLSIPVGIILAALSSCCTHRKAMKSVECVYGPPPTEEARPKPRPLVYGPMPTPPVETDTIREQAPQK